jgi:hypothetical protein
MQEYFEQFENEKRAQGNLKQNDEEKEGKKMIT